MRQAHIVNGMVDNVVMANQGFDYGDGSLCVPSETANIGDLYTRGVFTTPPSTTFQTQGLSFLQFLELLTPTEQAALVNSTDTQVRLFNLMAAGADVIDLTNPEVVQGVGYCAMLGLIASVRVPTILSGAPPA